MSKYVSATGEQLLFDPLLVPESLVSVLPEDVVVRLYAFYCSVDCLVPDVESSLLYRLDRLPVMTIPVDSYKCWPP